MGAPVPSFQVFGVHRCVDCGKDSDLSFNYCGKVRCITCDIQRMNKRSDMMAASLFVAGFLFIAMCFIMAVISAIRL